MKFESTKGKYCCQWGIVEAKSPSMFNDFSICSEECAKYDKELDTCIDIAHKLIAIKSIEKEVL